MSDVTAEAPVRANKAPARAKKPKASPPPAPATKPEWLILGLQHARQLCEMLYNLIDHHGLEEPAEGLVHELASTAESHLYALTNEDSHISTALEGQLYGEISMVVTMLKAAEHCAVHSPLGYPTNIHAAVLPSAVTYAQALMDALQAAPEDVSQLVKLDARAVMGGPCAGARTHREQPRPPIRRGPDYEDSLAKATGATAVFGCNMPGYLLFDSKASLVEFVEKSAAQTACLNVMLAYLVERHCMPGTAPDGSFLADFASFVSDQVYEHQEAVGALLKVGGAA